MELNTMSVRIDMAQMLQLKDMGYEALGPVNGPNEELPEYEVPKAWVEDLISHEQLRHALKPNEQGYDAESPLVEPSRSGLHPDNIDPALQGANQIVRQPDDNSHTGNNASCYPEEQSQHALKLNKQRKDSRPPLIELSRSTPHTDTLHAQDTDQIARQWDDNSYSGNLALTSQDAGRTIVQTTLKPIQHLPNEYAELAANSEGLANLPPPMMRQTKSTNKRKKLTADDWAALQWGARDGSAGNKAQEQADVG